MSNNTQLIIFNGWSGSSELFRVYLSKAASGYGLKTSVKTPTGWTTSSSTTLSNSWHTLNVTYEVVPIGGRTRASVTLKIDGTTASTVSYYIDLDNPPGELNSVRLGAQSIPSGASGSLWFDSFSSSKQSIQSLAVTASTPIELIPETPTPTVTPRH